MLRQYMQPNPPEPLKIIMAGREAQSGVRGGKKCIKEEAKMDFL